MSDDRRAAIVGLGLIGGSFAAALRTARPRWSIVGFDERAEVSSRAVTGGFVNRIASTADEALRDADLIVLATPVRVILELLGRLDRVILHEAIVLDVGSTKLAIAEAMRLAGTVTDPVSIRAHADAAAKALDASRNPNEIDGVAENGAFKANVVVGIVEGGKIKRIRLSEL